MHLFSTEDIEEAVGASAFSRGQHYQRLGRVLDVSISSTGNKITGAVQGSQERPYEVDIDLYPEKGKDTCEIDGFCTCRAGYNCKHVAALLLEAMAQPVASEQTQTEIDSAAGIVGLDRGLARWIDSLADALSPEQSNEFPEDLRQRLIYVLDNKEDGGKPVSCRVTLQSVRLLKDGRYSIMSDNYDASAARSTRPASFLRPNDRAILPALAEQRLRAFLTGNGYVIGPDEGRILLGPILETGRCHWKTADGPALSLGPMRKAEPAWQSERDGAQVFRFVTSDGGGMCEVLGLIPPWYVDPESGQCGPLETGLPERLAAVLAIAPPIPTPQTELVREAMRKRVPTQSLPKSMMEQGLLPAAKAEVEEQDEVIPIPHLYLFAVTMTKRGEKGRSGRDSTEEVPLLRLSFEYGNVRVRAAESAKSVTVAEGGRVRRIRRNLDEEKEARAKLSAERFAAAERLSHLKVPEEHTADLTIEGEDPGYEMLEFVHSELPVLREQGWKVEIDDDFPYRLAEVGEDWCLNFQEDGSGIDWFGIELGVEVDGTRLDLLPVLLRMLENLPDVGGIEALDSIDDDDVIFARLDDGRLAPLLAARVKPLMKALYELYEIDGLAGGRVKLPGIRIGDLEGLEQAGGEAGLNLEGAERLRTIAHCLTDPQMIEAVEPPKGLIGTLRSYQQQGLDWLQFLRVNGLGGILADDMGLGKTIQTLAHLLIEKESGRLDRPALVVAPTSLMTTWRREAERFAPSLNVLTLHGPHRKRYYGRLGKVDLILTTYPLLPRDREVILSHDYHLAILDEAQVIKNPNAAVTRVVRELKAKHRLCLTGTPMENHLGELWSLFNFLMPGLLGDAGTFRRLFRTPIEKHGDETRRVMLSRRVRPFLLRRTKEAVASELPAKTEITESVELEGNQRDLYESIRLAMHRKVREEVGRKGIARARITILDALLKLRQVCCDPRLLKMQQQADKALQSAKLDRLMELVPEMVEEGRRILLFSQFTSMLALIEEELKREKIPYVKLTGQTKDRSVPVERFQNEEVPLFLISLKAGGTGLTLTAADTVIHYDPWWNPAVEAQATDRAHRIGQDKAVFVYKLMTLGTVEEGIVALQERKRELAAGLFDPEAGGPLELSEEDLELLFRPLDPETLDELGPETLDEAEEDYVAELASSD